jgi:environmental stress-induced protein Ves
VSRVPGERFVVAALPARPWKNGGGITREIAASPQGAGLDHFDWRLSIADVSQDGPFSRFVGMDRQIVLLRGAGLRLRGEAGLDHRLDRIGTPFAFGGELAIDATLIDGNTQDLNVMTRRGAWCAQVATLRAPATVEAAPASLLLCGAGRWQLAGDGRPLQAGEGCLWRANGGPHRLAPTGGDVDTAWLVAVRLCHDRTP